jgi:tetratricopeptide (TPR) repeat protein
MYFFSIFKHFSSHRGTIYYLNENYEESIQDFTMGLGTNHDTIKFACYYQRANSYYKLQKFKEALSDLEEAESKTKKLNFPRTYQAKTYSIL